MDECICRVQSPFSADFAALRLRSKVPRLSKVIDHTLADWIRQCRRAGLFDQGRALYEKGGLNLDHLNETEQIEAEDDYRLCVRRGAATETKPRRKRRSTEAE